MTAVLQFLLGDARAEAHAMIAAEVIAFFDAQ